MSSSSLLLVSGIPAGHWGTGRLVAHIEREISRRRLPCDVVARPDRPAFRGRAVASAVTGRLHYELQRIRFRRAISAALHDVSRPLLIFHPQTLGFRLTIDAIARRRLPPALFLLDSSFFCIASYNHVSGEKHPCTRCAGGHFNRAAIHGCVPFPNPDPAARQYVGALRDLVRQGHVVLIAQTRRQAELAQQHFHLATPPEVAGLWTDDWDFLMDENSTRTTLEDGAAPWDVVFHGFDLEAKGARWLEAVASYMPARRFLFPFAQPTRTTPMNCSYIPSTWESGLESAIRAARIVAVPSLWSAPIEGALIKSVAVAAGTVVVRNTSAYADELPPDLVLALPGDPPAAARELEDALRGGWRADPVVKRAWIGRLRSSRAQFLDKLFGAVPGFGDKALAVGAAA